MSCTLIRVVSTRLIVLTCLLLISGCGAKSDWPGAFTPATLPAGGDAGAGKVLFQNGTLQVTACSACHIVDSSPVESGPSLAGVATRAESGWSGHSATDYLFRAIVYPNVHVVSGYSANLMPATYGQTLTPQQIRDLIAYLLTLK